jgi:hypothetical protein
MRQRNSLKNFNSIIFPQKGSFQHKTVSKKKFCFWDLNETAESFDIEEAFAKTIIGSQFCQRDTIAKTNTHVNITYLKLLENVNIKGELKQKSPGSH